MIKKNFRIRAREENGPSCRRRRSKRDARTRRGAFSLSPPRAFFLSFFLSFLCGFLLRFFFFSSSSSSTTNRIRAREWKRARVDSPMKKKNHSFSSLQKEVSLKKTTRANKSSPTRRSARKNTTNDRRYLRSRKTWRSSSNAPRGKTGRF